MVSFPALSLVDVGARGGLHPRWRRCGAPVRAIGFDADAAECERLNRGATGVRYLPYALGPEDGARTTLHLTRDPGSSSVYPPNEALVRDFPFGAQLTVERRVPVTVTTLDLVCDREGFAPDAIKLDVQGAELGILRGAERALGGALVLETEVEFQSLYEGQPLFHDVDQHMRARGWLLLGLRRAFWRRFATSVADGGTLVHGDALYVHEARLRGADRATLLKAMVALAAYRQMDYVASLAARVGEPGAVAQLAPPRPPWARVAGALMRRIGSHRQWRTWVDRCCPPQVTDWHDPDEFF